MPERKLIDLDQAHQVTAPNGTVYNVKVSNTGEFYTEKAADGVGNDAVALWKASSYDGTSQFLEDLSGNNHHLRIGSTQPAYVADGALYLPGVAGNYASTPDSANLGITGDIDVRVQVAFPDWSMGGLQGFMAGQWGGSNSWRFDIWYPSTLAIFHSTDGSDSTLYTSTATLPGGHTTSNNLLWVRFTRASSTGTLKFYYSSDGTSWTQSGTDVSTPSGALVNSTANLTIGHPPGAGTGGKFHRVEIRNGIDGEVVAKFDPSGQDDFTTSWYSETGEQWTVNSTAGTDTNEPKFLAKESSNYLYLPGVADNYINVPDEPVLDITGGLSISVDCALDDWTPSGIVVLLAKWHGPLNQRSYQFAVNTDGKLRLYLSPDGINDHTSGPYTSTIAPTVSDGSSLCVGVTRDGATGDVKFWTAQTGVTTHPGGTGWSQLGATVSGSATAIYASTSSFIIGATGTGTSNLVTGKYHRVTIRNVVNDQTVLDIDFSKASPSSNTFTAETGQTVTINRSTSGRKSVVVDRDLFLFGTDDYMETPDHPDLDFGVSDDLTLVAVIRPHGFGGAGARPQIISKRDTVGVTNTGWALYGRAEASPNYGFQSADGSSIGQNSNTGTVTFSQIHVVTAKVGNGSLTMFLNGETGQSTSLVGNWANSLPVRIGKNASGSGNPNLDAEFIGAAIWRRALTDEEIDLLPGEFGV